MKDASGLALFTTSTSMMSSDGPTKGSFATGQEAFVVTKEDIGGASQPDRAFSFIRDDDTDPLLGRTGARATFTDPINGHQSLLIGSRRNIKSEATVEDNRGVLAFIKWNDMEMDMDWSETGSGSGRSGDGSGTDVSIGHTPWVPRSLCSMT